MTERGNGVGIQFLRSLIGWVGDACVTWPLTKDSRGYGQCGVDGQLLRAHRVMCELAHGPAPSPAHHAAHSCGNGHLACVNPKHLSWKTASENGLDRRQHGTHATSKNGSRSPLTPTQVAEIRSLIGRMTVTAIAKRFDISRRTVERIRAGHNPTPLSQDPKSIRRRERERRKHHMYG